MLYTQDKRKQGNIEHFTTYLFFLLRGKYLYFCGGSFYDCFMSLYVHFEK